MSIGYLFYFHEIKRYGVGSRVGAEVPKQFIEVFVKPIVAYTIEKFQKHTQIDAIEVVCVEDYSKKCMELCSKYNYTKVKWIVRWGKDFQHSVLNGINNLQGKINEDDNKKSTEWVDRDKIMGLNVPHAYKFKYIENLYKRALEENVLDKVEPHTASLMYALGETIYFLKGNQTNIKITTVEDVKLFGGYVLRERMEEDRK